MCKRKLRKERLHKLLPEMYLENCMLRWKKACAIPPEVIIAYKAIGDTLTVYSDRPGFLIGLGGCNVDLLKQMLHDDRNIYRHIDKIEFKQIDGLLPDRPWTEAEIMDVCKTWATLPVDLM